MGGLPNARLTHVGLFVRDIEKMKGFYSRMLGMAVTDSGPFMGRQLAFLSRDPEEHHQLVMVQDPARAALATSVNQISFRLDDLESLRVYYRFLAEEKVKALEGRNHGNSWSLYFFDPEGNKIELYVPTPWHVSQPWRAPLDLTQPAEAIIEETKAHIDQNPTARPMSEWSDAFRVRLGQ